MDTWFIPSITSSMAWTLQAPFLVTCPAHNPRVIFQTFPALNVTNAVKVSTLFPGLGNNDALGFPAITENATKPITSPGQAVHFSWELPGKQVDWNKSYTTSTSAGAPKVCTDPCVLPNVNDMISSSLLHGYPSSTSHIPLWRISRAVLEAPSNHLASCCRRPHPRIPLSMGLCSFYLPTQIWP